MPAMIEAVKAGATVAEVLGTVRIAYGYDYDPFAMIQPSLVEQDVG